MKRSLKMLLLSAAILVMAMTIQTKDVKAATAVKYIDADGDEKECTGYTVVDGNTDKFETDKWYVVNSTVSVSGTITVSGTAHLILCDGASLTVTGITYKAGINVGPDASLLIYGQSGGSGILKATGGACAAGIGGNANASGAGEACGTVGIYGGTVEAVGGAMMTAGAAGIGGGAGDVDGGAGGSVTINGGEVTATGGNYGAGIGGGASVDGGAGGGAGGTVQITGGTVTALGGTYGAGIGGGACYGSGTGGAGGEVTIYDAVVTATGGGNSNRSAAGIGAGAGCDNHGDMYVGESDVVRAGASPNPTDVKEHGGSGEINLSGEQYYTVNIGFDPVTPTDDSVKASGNTVYRVVIAASGDGYICFRQGSEPEEREYIDYAAEEFNLTQEDAQLHYIALKPGENSRFLQGWICHSLKGYLQDLALQDVEQKTVVFDNLDTTYEIHLVSAEEFQILWNK